MFHAAPASNLVKPQLIRVVLFWWLNHIRNIHIYIQYYAQKEEVILRDQRHHSIPKYNITHITAG